MAPGWDGWGWIAYAGRCVKCPRVGSEIGGWHWAGLVGAKVGLSAHTDGIEESAHVGFGDLDRTLTEDSGLGWLGPKLDGLRTLVGA